MLEEASNLFTRYRGVWHDDAVQKVSSHAQTGESVVHRFCSSAETLQDIRARLSKARLRAIDCPVTPHVLTRELKWIAFWPVTRSLAVGLTIRGLYIELLNL